LKRFIDEKERRIRDRIIFHISKKLKNIEKRGERNGRVEKGIRKVLIPDGNKFFERDEELKGFPQGLRKFLTS
jgi:hypothetical protein